MTEVRQPHVSTGCRPALSVVLLVDRPRVDVAAHLGALTSKGLGSSALEVVLTATRRGEAALRTLSRRLGGAAVASAGEGGPMSPVATIVTPDGRSTGAARNAGARTARGATLLHVDDGLAPRSARRLLDEHHAFHRRASSRLLVTAAAGNGAAPAAWERVLAAAAASGPAPGRAPRAMSAAREVFERLGGFDESLDVLELSELLWRAAGMSTPLVFTAPIVEARPQLAFHEAARRLERVGAAALLISTRHPAALRFSPVGAFNGGRLRAVLLRRLLLALDVGPAPLRLLQSCARVSGHAAGCADFLAEFFFWRGVRRAIGSRTSWRRLTRGPVILTYHACAGRGEQPSHYVVAPRLFRRQMTWIRRAGYNVLDLEEWLGRRARGELPPARSVVITFDDGYSDNGGVAAPILREHGFTATVFLVTGYVGSRNTWDVTGPLAGRPVLSWDQVRSLRAGPLRFGGHTRRHPSLPGLDPCRLRDEVGGCRDDIEAALGQPARTFAYPYGRHDALAREAALAAGFVGALTIRPGINDPAVPDEALRRVTISGRRSLLAFAVAVELGVPNLWRALRAGRQREDVDMDRPHSATPP